MVNGDCHLDAGTHDLRLERGDPPAKLFHRQRIEILPPEQGERVVGPLRGKIVGFHACSVDRPPVRVNKPAPN